MDHLRVKIAVEAAARALHESIRDRHQFRWESMSDNWHDEMRQYVRPSVLAALEASDDFLARKKPATSVRPRLVSVGT